MQTLVVMSCAVEQHLSPKNKVRRGSLLLPCGQDFIS